MSLNVPTAELRCSIIALQTQHRQGKEQQGSSKEATAVGSAAAAADLRVRLLRLRLALKSHHRPDEQQQHEAEVGDYSKEEEPLEQETEVEEEEEEEEEQVILSRPLPPVTWPLPPAELRVAERHRRDDHRRQRRERKRRRRRRRQQQQRRATGPQPFTDSSRHLRGNDNHDSSVDCNGDDATNSTAAGGGGGGGLAGSVAARLLCVASGGSPPSLASATTASISHADGSGASPPAAHSIRSSASPHRRQPSQSQFQSQLHSQPQCHHHRQQQQQSATPALTSQIGFLSQVGSVFTSVGSHARHATMGHGGGGHHGNDGDSDDDGQGGSAVTSRSFILHSPGSSGFFYGTPSSSSSLSSPSPSGVLGHRRRRRSASDSDSDDDDDDDGSENESDGFGGYGGIDDASSRSRRSLKGVATSAAVGDGMEAAKVVEPVPHHNSPAVVGNHAHNSSGEGQGNAPTDHGTALGEMDAIAHGLASPYRAYLFTPHPRTIDMNTLCRDGGGGGGNEIENNSASNTNTSTSGSATATAARRTSATTTAAAAGPAATRAAAQPQWGTGGVSSSGKAVAAPLQQQQQQGYKDATTTTVATPIVAATCVAFSPTGECYAVGSSDGTLLFVPLPPAASGVISATYLGSIRSRGSVGRGGDGVGVGVDGNGVEGNTDAVGGTTATGATGSGEHSRLTPIPLRLAHTAAVISIAFHDDGGIFASASADMSVMLWGCGGSTSASAVPVKLRRFRVNSHLLPAPTPTPTAAAATSSSSSSPPMASALAMAAPQFIRFTPLNNNYLIVGCRREGRLYNVSTGLPLLAASATFHRHSSNSTDTIASGVASSMGSSSVGIAGHDGSVFAPPRSRLPFFLFGGGSLQSTSNNNTGSIPFSGGGGGGVVSGMRRRSHAMTPSFITAVAVDACAAPFFFLGDSQGTVQLCTYRAAGDQADTATTTSGGGGGGGGLFYSSHASMSTATATSSSSTATTFVPSRQLPELRPLAFLSIDSHGGQSAPFYPIARLEVCGANAVQLTSVIQAQQTLTPRREEREGEGLWPAVMGVASSGNSNSKKKNSAATGSGGSGNAHPTGMTPPARLADTFSSFWSAAASALTGGGGDGSSSSAGAVPVARDGKPADARGTGDSNDRRPGAAKRADPAAASPVERLSPLILAASQPCDSVSLIGLTIDQHQYGQEQQQQWGIPSFSSATKSGPNTNASTVPPPSSVVRYSLVRLLDVRGAGRLRHVGSGSGGLGAVLGRDNTRLVVLAMPCEEGFVRLVLTSAIGGGGGRSTPSTGGGGVTVRGGGGARLSVAATLPVPYGGLPHGLAWSPDGRFLVATTREGVVFQWERVYLPGERTGGGGGNGIAAMATTHSADNTVAGVSGATPSSQPPATATTAAVSFPQQQHSAAIVLGRPHRNRDGNSDSGREGGGGGGSGGSGCFTGHGHRHHHTNHHHQQQQQKYLLEEEEEKWRESVRQEREHQLAVRRRQRRSHRHRQPHHGGGGGGGDDGGSNSSSSGYWLDGASGRPPRSSEDSASSGG